MNTPLPALFSAVALVVLFGPAARAQPLDAASPPGAAVHADARHAASAFRRAPAAVASGASANFDATYYHLDLDVSIEEARIDGSTLVRGRAVARPLQTLALDLDSDHLSVDAVETAAGEALPFTHGGDVLRIALPEAVAVGAPVAVRVRYGGTPGQSGFGTFGFGTENGNPYFWTLSEPYGAREWWPSKDHPSDKADSVRITVTVPEELRVGSNGVLVADPAYGDGTVTYDWITRYPIASYLVSLAGGVYEVFEQTYERPAALAAEMGPLDLPVLHYAYRDGAETTYHGGSELYGWKKVVDVLPVLEDWFGPYPFPDEKYGHAQFTWGGGMEHQTMSSMGSNWLGLVTHELAHQWYGDLVTMTTWPHLWLNEGFATYGELLYWQARHPEAYEGIFDLYYDRARGAPGTLLVTGDDTASVSTLFDFSRVYAKGGIVLHMLRGVVGDDAFREILRTYAYDEAVRYGNAVTADFQRVAEAVSGRDLDTFFAQWVTHGTGYPVYAVGWTAEPDGDGHRVEVTVTQTQDEGVSNLEVFEMPVTITVQTDGGERRFTVVNDRRRQSYTFDVADAPTDVVFDPDRLILHNTPVLAVASGGPVEVPDATALAAVYPNPAAGVLHVDVDLAADGPVEVAVYDALGRRVRVLVDRSLPAGPHHFTLATDGLPAGTYVVRLRTGGGVAHRRVVVV